MRNPNVFCAGGVMSADIAVPDHERELEFYSKVLTTGDVPLWRDDLMNNQGTPIIGLGAQAPEYNFLPQQWMPHFQVNDVAASAACALNLGGKELIHGRDDDGQSQWAVLVDPDGAAFGVVPLVPEESGTLPQGERYGRISWLSLVVPNASASREFYQQVIGLGATPIDAEENEGLTAVYEMQTGDKHVVAEICQYDSMGAEFPPVWLIHLPVGDLTESLQRVKDNGGEVLEYSNSAQYAIIRDPVGVIFALRA